MMITALQAGILQDVEKHHRDEQAIPSSTTQMPPQNLTLTPQQQQQQSQQQHQEQQQQQMSQALVDQHTGVSVSMADQHPAHALDHTHSMAEHAAHSMLNLSEQGGSLDHLTGSGHASQSLPDLTQGRASDQSLDSVSANGRRPAHDRMSSLGDSNNPPMRQLSSNERDIAAMASSANSNASNTNLVSGLSGLAGSSLSDRQTQPMRNMTPVGTDRGGQHGGGMGTSMPSDGRGSVGLPSQSMAGGGGNGNSLQEPGGGNPQSLNFNPEQSSQSLLDSISSAPPRGRPPSMGGAQHNLASVDQQHGGASLPPHLRALAEHQAHSHQSLVDHHNQNVGGDGSSASHNGRGNLSAFGLDSTSSQLHSRPGSTLLSEANNRTDARDLPRAVYSSSSSAADRNSGHQSSSLIEETIAAVASNLNKSSPDGGVMPGPLPPNSLMGLGSLGLARSASVASHLGHGSDESLADLVGRHHTHSIPMLSERASQSLSGLMDEHSMNQSGGHGPGRELEKTHPCLTCLKMFRSKQQLAQHSLVHTGIRKHICSFCDRAFKQLSHLQQHVRIHTGERKYVCQICNRAFKQLTHLQKHHVIHTGERKYVCQCCDRAFKQLTHLQQHYRIHTGEKPYKCKFENCERAFAQLSNLQHHMRNHDDQVKKEATRIHKCQICHRCYTNESSLKSHTLKMHIHIKPIDQHPAPAPKKRRKRKKDLYGGAPTMVPVSSSGDGTFGAALQGMRASGTRPRSPTSSDDDEIIFVGEQMGPPRVDNFAGATGGLGGQGQMLQGPGGRGHDLSHQIPFSGMGNFSRGADPLALLASANRFTLQDNMMSSLGGPLNSFSDQLTFRDAALLNSRFGDLRGGPPQGTGFDDRFPSGNFNQQQQPQRDRDSFGNHSDMNNRGSAGNNNNNNNNSNNTSNNNSAATGGGSGSGDNNMQAHNGNSTENRNQIPAHNQGMLRGAGMGGLSGGVGGMMHGAGQGTLGGLMKQIKQEPLDYFPSSCHGGDQFAGMGVSTSGGFLSPQHIINSHLRGQLPSLNVPLIRDHFSHNQMLPHSSSSSSASSGSSSTPVSNVPPSSTSSSAPLASTTPSSLASLPLGLTHMGLYHQPHFSSTQRMGGLHPSPASTPSSQLSVGGANLPSNLSTQGGRSPLEQEDLRCFSPLRN